MNPQSLATVTEIAKDIGIFVSFIVSVAAVACAKLPPPPDGTKAAVIFAVVNWLGQNYGYARNAGNASNAGVAK